MRAHGVIARCRRAAPHRAGGRDDIAVLQAGYCGQRCWHRCAIHHAGGDAGGGNRGRFAVDTVQPRTQRGGVVGGGLIAVVAEAPAAGADQRGQARAAGYAAAIQRGPPAGAGSDTRHTADDDVAAR